MNSLYWCWLIVGVFVGLMFGGIIMTNVIFKMFYSGNLYPVDDEGDTKFALGLFPDAKVSGWVLLKVEETIRPRK